LNTVQQKRHILTHDSLPAGHNRGQDVGQNNKRTTVPTNACQNRVHELWGREQRCRG